MRILVMAVLTASACVVGVPKTPTTTTSSDTRPSTTTPAGTTTTAPGTSSAWVPTVPITGTLVPPATIAGESSYCWFLGGWGYHYDVGLYAVGMDSGTIEPVIGFGAIPIGMVDGLAYT